MQRRIVPTAARHGALRSRGRALRWTQHFWGRLLTVFVLAFGAPGCGDAASEIISALAGIECCEDDCGTDGSQGCSMTCSDCACCGHVGSVAVVLPPAVFWLGVQVMSAQDFVRRDHGPYTSGYRTPPFRPPLG